MKSIIEIYSGILVLMLCVYANITVLGGTEQVKQAESYKAAVVSEIENSNFNPEVIAGCVAEAAQTGYSLQVNNYIYDTEHDIQTAEVALTYQYRMPLFGISETRTTRGIAR